MADTKLSGLTAASALDGTELLYAVQSATSKKATAAQLRTYALSASAANYALGGGALASVTTGGDNVAVGDNTLHDNLAGNNSIAIGDSALQHQVGTGGNIAIGGLSLLTMTTGYQNVAVGLNTLRLNLTGVNNVAVGNGALYNALSSFNVGIGADALYWVTSGQSNTGVGYQALMATSTGADNTGVGNQALIHNTTGSYNAALGERSLDGNTTGSYNAGLGGESGYIQASGSYNTFLGGRAGRGVEQLVTVTGASGNGTTVTFTFAAITRAVETGTTIDVTGVTPSTYNGRWVVTGGTTTTMQVASTVTDAWTSGGTLNVKFDISRSVVVGFEALYNPDTGADDNVAFGYRAGYAIRTGARNILIGTQAGDTITTGSRNILIGYDVETAAADTANFLSIGNLIFGTGADGTGTTAATGKVGIKLAAPGHDLDIGGDLGVTTSTRVYNVRGANYESLRTYWSSNFAFISTDKAGSGSLRPIVLNASEQYFQTGGVSRIGINSSGHFYAVTTASYDIGADASRFRDAYLSRNIFQGAGIHEMTETTAPSGVANTARIWAEDDGAGKTRLMVRFGTGAALQIAIEP